MLIAWFYRGVGDQPALMRDDTNGRTGERHTAKGPVRIGDKREREEGAS